MPLKIRSKLLVAFLAILFPFTIIAGILVFYNASAFRKAAHKVETVSEERAAITNIILALERALMPGNDYLITADRKYIDDFYKASQEVEKRMKEAEGVVSGTEDMNMLGDTLVAWRNIKDISQKIFEIQDPQATVETQHPASLLMEEMDYRWAYPAIERLKNWRGMHLEEYKKAVNISHKVWVRSWIIMGIVVVMLIISGVSLAIFYSNFFVRPIQSIHNGADAIAAGNFKTRLDIKTGDEIEQLSNAMNEMAEQLDSFTANLQGMVEERTKELKAMLEASQAVMRQKGFAERARAIFDISKGLIGASAGYVALVSRNGTRNELLFLDSGGRECTVDRSLPMPIRGLREQAYKAGKAVYENDFAGSEWMRFMPEGHVRLDNVLFAPLMTEGNPIGLIGLANKPVGFNDNDARLLTAFGDIAAIAMMESMAGDALKESEERYRGIFEKTPNAMVVFDAETLRFENVNRGAIDLYGYTEEEFLSLTPVDVSAEVEKTRESIQNGLAEESAHVPVRYHKKKDGTVFPIEIYMGTFLLNGRPKGFAVIMDLTEAKKAEEKLRESEDRYRVLGMTAPNAMICLKAPDTVIFWNRRAREMFGYSEEEIVGKPFHGLIVPEKYRERARDGMKNFFKTGTGPVVGKKTELSALRRDGTEFPIELSLSAMNIRGEWQATGIVRDITDRKLAEEALRHERDLAQTYLNIAGVMFVIIDSNEKVTLVNKRGAEVLGCPEVEIIGKNWFDEFLPERARDEIRGVFRKLIRGEDDSAEYVENPVLARSGEERLIAWHNIALKDEAGKIIATLSSGEDITDRKKAEEALKQRINELEQFRKVTIKRELRMEELQRKVDELEKELKRK